MSNDSPENPTAQAPDILCFTEAQRAEIALAALRSLSIEMAHETACVAIAHCEYPLPPLMDTKQEALRVARAWTEYATPTQIKAFALACFDAMPPVTRREFLKWAGKQ